MRNGSMDEDSGRFNVRHDRHQVDGLMARRFVDLQRVGQSAVIIARVGDAADNRDRDFFDAVIAIERVHGADQPGRVAGG